LGIVLASEGNNWFTSGKNLGSRLTHSILCQIKTNIMSLLHLILSIIASILKIVEVCLNYFRKKKGDPKV